MALLRVGSRTWRLVWVAALLGVALAGVASAAPGEPYALQAVPVLDVNGPVLGAEVWLAGEPWLAYLGGGWELPDPTDPDGAGRAGIRGRMGLTIPVSGDDTVDLRVAHWPVSWIPGWDGTTGLMVAWQHPASGGVAWRLGAVVANVWARREGVAPVRAVVGSLGAEWELAPELVARPSLEAVVGTGVPSGYPQERPLFGAVVGSLPFFVADSFRLEARAGFAWPPTGALVPGVAAPDQVGRLGFRAGGWPAEFFVRGAAPAGDQEPGRAALGLSVERRFDLPELPPSLRWWPDARGYVAVFADAAVKASDLSFSKDAATATGFGVAAGLVSGAVGKLEAFLGVSDGPTVRLGAWLRPLP